MKITTDVFNYTEYLHETQKAVNSKIDPSLTSPVQDPAVNVNLTEKSRALAEEAEAAKFANQTVGKAADGSTVSVQRTGVSTSQDTGQELFTYSATIQTSDGKSFTLDFDENVRINQENGTYSAYFKESNKTRTYSADGSYTEIDGDLGANTDADSIHIGVNGSAIKTGNGNNLVFVYGDNASVTGGNGNDSVYIADNVTGTSIDVGEGNDTISGNKAYNTNINLGSGNNTVAFQQMHGGSITGAHGNNTIESPKLNGVNISLGDGNNFVKSNYFYGDATLSAGDGNNAIDIDHVGMIVTRRDDRVLEI